MTDLPYVLAAYLVVVGTLGGYAIRLGRRLERARRRRALLDAPEQGLDAAPSDLRPPTDRP